MDSSFFGDVMAVLDRGESFLDSSAASENNTSAINSDMAPTMPTLTSTPLRNQVNLDRSLASIQNVSCSSEVCLPRQARVVAESAVATAGTLNLDSTSRCDESDNHEEGAGDETANSSHSDAQEASTAAAAVDTSGSNDSEAIYEMAVRDYLVEKLAHNETQQELQEKTQQVAQLQATLEKQRKENARKIAEINLLVSEVQTAAERMKQDLERVASDKLSLAAHNKKLLGELDEAQAELEDTRSELEQMAGAVHIGQVEQARLVKEVAELRTEIIQLTEEKARAVNEAMGQVAVAQEEKEQLQRKLEEDKATEQAQLLLSRAAKRKHEETEEPESHISNGNTNSNNGEGALMSTPLARRTRLSVARQSIGSPFASASASASVRTLVAPDSCTPKKRRRLGHCIPHVSRDHTFHSGSCGVCHKKFGLRKKGKKCSECGFGCHIECEAAAPPTCGMPQLPQHALKERGNPFAANLNALVATERDSAQQQQEEQHEQSSGTESCAFDDQIDPHESVVPSIVVACCDAIERRGLDMEGLYRVPGQSSKVTALAKKFQWGSSAADALSTMGGPLLDSEDVPVICGTLKLFLRGLKDPVIPYNLYEAFLTAGGITDRKRRTAVLAKLVKNMPAAHFDLLQYLVNHLKRVAQSQDKNKMTYHNLASVFGPTLMSSKGDSHVHLMDDVHLKCHVVETLLQMDASEWEKD